MLTIFFILIYLELEVMNVCAGGSNGIFEVMKKAIQYNIFHNIFPSIKNESTCLGYEERCPELLAGKNGDLSTKEVKQYRSLEIILVIKYDYDIVPRLSRFLHVASPWQ